VELSPASLMPVLQEIGSAGITDPGYSFRAFPTE
jgi:hypothetical protein